MGHFGLHTYFLFFPLAALTTEALAAVTLGGKWRYLIPAITPIHNHVLIPNYQDFKIQDFRYCDGFECFQAINIGRYEHGIKMEFSVPRTPQQNGIIERKNRTLIEAARTLLADSLLPIPFWAEAVYTACYVQNRVLVTKPHNKNPYELLHGRLLSIGFMRPFGCPETLHVNFMENKPNVAGSGPAWLFDIDSLSQTMNYHPVIAKNQSNLIAGFQDTEKAGEEGTQTYVLFPVLSDGSTNSHNSNKDALVDGKEHDDDIQKSVSPDIHSLSSGFRDLNAKFEECNNNSSNGVNAASSSVSTAGQNSINSTNDFSATGPSNAAMPNLEDLSHDADDVGAEADINKLESIISVSHIPTTRIHKDHLTSQIIGDLSSTTHTKSMARAVRDQGRISQMFNEDFHTCMFACFLLQEEPKRVHQALKDPSWIEAMQEELLQFKMQKVWILVDLPYGKRAI
nr:hypothetical protein [Tanacetum cinerariifolium]